MDCWAFTTSQRQLCFLFFFLPVKNKHNLRINQFHYLDNKLHLIADYNQIHIIELSSLVTPPPPFPRPSIPPVVQLEAVHQAAAFAADLCELFWRLHSTSCCSLLTTCFSLSTAKRTTQRYLWTWRRQGGGVVEKNASTSDWEISPLRRENSNREIYYELINGYWLIIISGRLTGACPTAATTNTFALRLLLFCSKAIS